MDICRRTKGSFSRVLLFASWSKKVCGIATCFGSTDADQKVRNSPTRGMSPSEAIAQTNLQNDPITTGLIFRGVWRQAELTLSARGMNTFPGPVASPDRSTVSLAMRMSSPSVRA